LVESINLLKAKWIEKNAIPTFPQDIEIVKAPKMSKTKDGKVIYNGKIYDF